MKMGLGMRMEGMEMGVGMGIRMETGMGMDRMRCEWMEWDAIGNGWNEMRLGMDGMRCDWECMEWDTNGNGWKKMLMGMDETSWDVILFGTAPVLLVFN